MNFSGVKIMYYILFQLVCATTTHLQMKIPNQINHYKYKYRNLLICILYV